MLKLSHQGGELKLSQVFEVASGARTSTEIIDVQIAYHHHVGYGQASFPPYMKEKREENLAFLDAVDFSHFDTPFYHYDIMNYLDSLSLERRPAKAAIDMALYDLMGKVAGLRLNEYLGYQTQNISETSFTIGIGKDDFIISQILKSKEFGLLKIKLGGNVAYNKHVIELVQQHTSQALGVDFNQGMQDKKQALDIIEWLADKQVKYVEQPLPVHMKDESFWLKLNSPLEIYGDESIQTAADILDKHSLFHGINVKLMKCGGVGKAIEMAQLARNFGLKTMLGCMVESSLAITAAAHISKLFDRLDLDGHLALANDPYTGIQVRDGQILLPAGPGLGCLKHVN